MKIDFYVLETSSAQQAAHFACQLLEKWYAEQKLPIFIHMNTREEAERFDALLWTYKDDSFIPHQLYAADNTAPVQIGYGESPAAKPAVLFNFSKEIPAFYAECEHVIEIVFNDALMQQLARQRYKQYRDHGHDINTIK
jgi:DNA polymerase-3 subunit chi